MPSLGDKLVAALKKRDTISCLLRSAVLYSDSREIASLRKEYEHAQVELRKAEQDFKRMK